MTEKRAKSAVDFEHPAQGKNHCGMCEHFIGPHGCELVRGHINAGDWCKLFAAAKANKSARDDLAEAVKKYG